MTPASTPSSIPYSADGSQQPSVAPFSSLMTLAKDAAPARYSVRRAMQDLADGKEFGELHNQKYGTIKYPIGKSGKKGYGLLHIVEQRMTKDGATLDEALNTAIKVGEAAEIGKETEQRHNTHHLDLDGTRAIIGEMPDKTIVITGYEINTEESTVAKQRAAELSPRPHVRSEEVFRALKEKLASTPHSIPYSADGSQQPSVAPATERELSPENARIRNSIIAGVRGKARNVAGRKTNYAMVGGGKMLRRQRINMRIKCGTIFRARHFRGKSAEEER